MDLVQVALPLVKSSAPLLWHHAQVSHHLDILTWLRSTRPLQRSEGFDRCPPWQLMRSHRLLEMLFSMGELTFRLPRHCQSTQFLMLKESLLKPLTVV